MVYPSLPPGFNVDIQQLLDAGLSKVASGRPVAGQIIADEGGGRATVNIGGKQLSLFLGTGRVNVGQSFTAQLSQGRFLVNLGNHQTSVSLSSLIGQSTPRPLASVLSNMGAPTTPAAQNIAQALMSAGMPLSAELVSALTQVLPQVTGQDIPALAFLFGRGFPISPQTTQTTQRLLSNRSKLGEGLGELDRGLSRLQKQLDAAENRVTAIQHRDDLEDRRQNLKRQFTQWSDGGETDKEQLAKEIEKSVQAQSSSAEAVRFAGASGAQMALALYDLYLYLIHLQELGILGQESQIASLLNQVNDLYESLAGQNLRNLPEDNPECPPVYFFQVPIVLEGENRTLELYYRQHSRNPEDGGTLVLRLDLSQLGPIKIALDLREGMLSATLTVTSPEIKQAVEAELDQLKEALEKAGLKTASVGVVCGTVPSTLREEVPETALPTQPTHGLDMRA